MNTIRLVIHLSQYFGTKFNNEITSFCTILNMLKLDGRETLPMLVTMIDHTCKPSSFYNKNIPYGQRLTSHEVRANGRSRISLKRRTTIFYSSKKNLATSPSPSPDTHTNPRLLHWVLLTTSSVTTSTQILRAIFFVSKLLMVMSKSSVTTSTCAFNEQFLLHLYRPQRSWGKVIFSEACVENSVHRGGAVRGRGCVGHEGHMWQGHAW